MSYTFIFRTDCMLRIAVLLLTAVSLPAASNVVVRMQTDLGSFDIELLETDAPLTVTNFLNYVNDGDYEGTFIHRSVSGFIVQGGGFIFDGPEGSFLTGGTSHIPTDPPVTNEFKESNLRGTIAMAKLGGDPNSATSEWFFNLADNSDNLDNQNGGFTVFARVLGDGMDVIDAIAALPVCSDVAPFPQLCTTFTDVPFVGPDDVFNNDTLVNITKIGADNDGDGAIDDLEDNAPDNGDGNGDAVLDSTQQHVASFPDETGEFVTIEAQPASPLRSLDVLGVTFAIASPDTSDVLVDREFIHGYFGFDITAAVPGDNTVSVILPAGASPTEYFNYGPTPDNASPHWYKFMFDGVTGAEINGNVIKLHYADGLRGDADLLQDGEITATRGGPANVPGDEDGVPDVDEDGAPNNGDGNMDGIADSAQSHVASLVDIRGSYVTVEANAANILRSLTFTEGNDFLAQAEPLGSLNGLNFVYGFLSFEVANVNAGSSVDIKIILPAGESAKKYFKFGPTPDNPVDHLYEFDFDGETGAEFNGNEVTLHFVDGKRGDSDLLANGVITDPGTPALRAQNAGSGGGSGGCGLRAAGNAHAGQAGAWLLLCLAGVYAAMRKHKANGRSLS